MTHSGNVQGSNPHEVFPSGMLEKPYGHVILSEAKNLGSRFLRETTGVLRFAQHDSLRPACFTYLRNATLGSKAFNRNDHAWPAAFETAFSTDISARP